MILKVISKTIFTVFAMGMVLTLLSNDAFAHGHNHCGGGGDGGGSVPEIGAGSAAGALSLLVGWAYLLKDRFCGTRDDKTAE